jgi:predicted Zn-dependent protease
LWSNRSGAAARTKLAGLTADLDRLSSADRATLRRTLAETWARLGDAARAEEQWQQLAVELPQDVRSRFMLVELALQANQLERAGKLLGELRKLEGAQGMLWRYGTAALRLLEARNDRSKLAEAGKLLADLQRQHPDWDRLPLLQASADELAGQFDSAARHYEKAVQRGETHPAVVGRLLELLLERQEYLRAEEALSHYLARRPLTPALARLGAEVAAGNRNGPRALARARQAVPVPSNDYRDYLWLAHLEQAVGDWTEAENLLREALRLADHVPDVWVALVEQLGRTGQADAAEKVLSQLREKLPVADWPLTLARSHEALHQLTQAEAEYDRALAARPDDFVVLAWAADFFVRQDRPERAEPLLRRLISPAVAAPAEHTTRARRQLAVLIASHSGAEALSLVHGDSVADERARWFVRGQDAAQLPGVLTQFEESLKRQPPSAVERLLVAELYLAAGKAAQARTALQPLMTQSAPVPQHVARYVRVLIRGGDLKEAATQLAQLERWEPQTARTQALRDELAKARAKKK